MRILVLQPQEADSAKTTWGWMEEDSSLQMRTHPSQYFDFHFVRLSRERSPYYDWTYELQNCELINGCFF